MTTVKITIGYYVGDAKRYFDQEEAIPRMGVLHPPSVPLSFIKFIHSKKIFEPMEEVLLNLFNGVRATAYRDIYPSEELEGVEVRHEVAGRNNGRNNQPRSKYRNNRGYPRNNSGRGTNGWSGYL